MINALEVQSRRMEVTGIGPVTSLAYVLIWERYRDSPKAAMWVHIWDECLPKKIPASQPQLGISKAGKMLRSLLVGSAHYILGPFGWTAIYYDLE